MKLYVAGPMSGIPDHNHPAFHMAAQELRQLGFVVTNPAETTFPAEATYADRIKDGLGKLLECDGIALLPGWQGSIGARLELRVAQACGLLSQSVPEWIVQARELGW